jgi:2-polyprenyl-3-methyl-5-hydroxy-6-metoxy-1,4-benzoquinol methylase
MKEAWNNRYSQKEYVYGVEPNEFLKENIRNINPGKILLIAEGEGRNAVYAAKQGWEVDAVDYSEEGKRKAEVLASKEKVQLNYELKDLTEFFPKPKSYDAIGIFYAHLEPEVRKILFEKCINALRQNGLILFECFDKDQLSYSSGGPKNPELLYSLEEVVVAFIDLWFEKLSKEKVFLQEGNGHVGEGIVIRFIGRKE